MPPLPPFYLSIVHYEYYKNDTGGCKRGVHAPAVQIHSVSCSFFWKKGNYGSITEGHTVTERHNFHYFDVVMLTQL